MAYYSAVHKNETLIPFSAWKNLNIITKRHEKTFGSNGLVHYLDCGDDFINVYIWKNLKNDTVKYEQFVIY